MESPTEIPAVLYREPDAEKGTPTVKESFEPVTPSTSKWAPYTPTRRNTREMWKRTWNAAVREGRWPRLVYTLIGLSLGAIWVGITYRFAVAERNWARKESYNIINAYTHAQTNDSNSGGIVLDGSLKKFDQSAGVLTVSWAGMFLNITNGTTTANADTPEVQLDYPQYPTGYPLWPYPVNIWRDVDTTTVVPNTTIWGTDYFEKQFIWVLKNASTPHIATIGNTAWDSFDTDIEFQEADITNVWHQPLFGYPLDRMVGNITFVAGQGDPTYLTAFNISSYIFPLTGARLTDYSFNWRFAINSTTECKSPEDYTDFWNDYFYGNISNVYNETLSVFTFPCHLTVMFTASRPPLVQFAAVMAVIVNWTSTLFIFVLTCETLVMRRGWMLSGTDLLGVTFTALFALPTVRSLLPGAPDFGVLIDLIGIIPNVIVISLCITAIAITKLNKKRRRDSTDTRY